MANSMVIFSKLYDRPLMTNEWSRVVKNLKMVKIGHVTYHSKGNFMHFMIVTLRILLKIHVRSKFWTVNFFERRKIRGIEQQILIFEPISIDSPQASEYFRSPVCIDFIVENFCLRLSLKNSERIKNQKLEKRKREKERKAEKSGSTK